MANFDNPDSPDSPDMVDLPAANVPVVPSTAFLRVQAVLGRTDRIAGKCEAVAAAMPSIIAKMKADITAVYGYGTAANLPLSDPNAINIFGPASLKSATYATGQAVYANLLAGDAAALSSYLLKFGGAAAGLPVAVKDVTSYLRYNNGCADPSPAGQGAGSSFAYLAHPAYAALMKLLSGGGSALPADVVFAPTGTVLGQFGFASGFAPGLLMLSAPAPFAPVGAAQFVVRCGNAAALPAPTPGVPATLAGSPPNGSLFIVVTGTNQAGQTATWRGDAGTGLTQLGQTLPANALQGTAGGANGGTAAPTDRLARISGIALDPARQGSATQGNIDIIAISERFAL